MKRIYQFILIAWIGTLLLSSCQKAEPLAQYADGNTPVLSPSATVIAAVPADSNKIVLALNWTDPGYGQEKSLYKYYLEVDSAARNFSKATRIDITQNKDERAFSFTAKALNDILFSFGFEFNVTYDIDIRVVSSYANNNEQRKSAAVRIKVTPYKVPPKVALPSLGSLFIVGAATAGGWENPVPAPSQEFSKIDETTYGGIFQLNGGEGYLLLPVNGSWDTKYAIKDNQIPGVDEAGTFFSSDGPGNDFKAPANSGLYKITVDFQRGIYKVEPFTDQHGLPSDLFIIGGATPGGWNNPVPVPNQQLTRKNSVEWDINLNFKAGEKYLLLPTNGSWGQKFGADNPDAPNAGLGGKIKPEGADMPAPANTGNYKFSVNFFTGMYSLSPQ
jgi:hypothetical protein